ncbi:MAG: DUF4252 domain-containing protein [Saprospiraceae bacterium]
MRCTIFALTLILPALGLQAQDMGLYWKYKDYDGAISFSVPRMLIHAGSWFVGEQAERDLLRKVHKVRVLAFENGESPVTDTDLKGFMQKAERNGLEQLITVRERDKRFWVYALERGNAVRKIVVLAKSPTEFGLVSVFGKFRYDEIGELVSSLAKLENGNQNIGMSSAIPMKTLSRIGH